MASVKLVLLGIVAVTAIALFVLVNYTVLPSEPNDKQSDYKNPENESIKDIFDAGISGSTSITFIDSPYVKEYSLPNGTWTNAILVDKNGIVWTAGSKLHALISFDPKTGQTRSSYVITKDKLSDYNNISKGGLLMVWTMVEDADGFLWFSQFGSDPLWRFDPHTEKFNVFRSVSGSPFQMKTDKETGNIWFTTLTRNSVGVIQKINEKESEPTYKITEFKLGADTYPSGLFLEKDHAWITQMQNHKLVRFDVAKENGAVVNITNKFEIPSGEKRLYLPTDVLVLDDNSVWFTEHGTSTVTRYNVDSQTLTRFPTSASPYQTTTLPFWMRQSADGDGFWFNEHTGNRIAFFNTVDMVLTEYEIPTRPSDGYIVYPLGIAIDPADSKKLWFSEWNTDKIAVVDRSIPITFDIRSDVTGVVLNGDNNTANIDIEIVKNSDASFLVNSKNNILYLRTSSSMEPAAGFVNVTANFSTDIVDLTNVKNTRQTLLLRNDLAPLGNYTLAISATDGIVTKSIFLNLEIAR